MTEPSHATRPDAPEDAARHLLRLEREVAEQALQLRILHEMAGKIGHSLTYEELFRTLLSHVRRAVGCDFAAGLLFARDGADLFVWNHDAAPPAGSVDRLLEAANRIGARELTAGDLRLVEIGEEPTDAPRRVAALASFFQVPIHADGDTIGLLLVGSSRADRFDEHQVRFLYTLVGQAAEVVRRLQGVLSRERDRLQTVVGHLPEGVLLVGCDGKVQMTNGVAARHLEALAQLGADGVIERLGGMRFDELVARDSCELKTDAAGRTLRVDVVNLDAGSSTCWLLVITDISEQKDELRRRDRFLAMLAHELRNPLAAISMAAGVLRKTDDEMSARSRGVCEIISNQVRHMARMVDDLLDVSRYLHGKIKLDVAAVDLAEIVARSLDTLQPTLDKKSHRLRYERPAGPLFVRGDGVRLTQVVTNLVHNAAKYTPPGGRIDVRVAAQAGAARLRVVDSGIGMTPDELAVAFQPFEQARQGIERSEGGLGLGLALVKMAVELHGGEIEIASDGIGTGCRVEVQLPAAAPPVGVATTDGTAADGTAADGMVADGMVADGMVSDDMAAGGATDAASTSSDKRRVLVVEDDSNIRDCMGVLLKNSGFDVRTTADGIGGLEVFKAWRPEAVVLDIGLPGKDGFEVAAEIRQDAGGIRPKLIAISGYDRPEDRHRSAEAGFDHHFAKPVDLDVLLSCLDGREPDGR